MLKYGYALEGYGKLVSVILAASFPFVVYPRINLCIIIYFYGLNDEYVVCYVKV